MANVWKGNRECRTYPSWMWGISPDVVFGKAQQRSKDFNFQVIRALGLVTSEVPWFSKTQPKPMYENKRAIAYWDIPLYADNTHVKANRIDATIADKENKKVLVIEMSCPWVENMGEKDADKTTKYGSLRWALEQRYPECRVTQFNIIVDVPGGY